MARLCEICGINLDKFGPRHRSLSEVAGEKPLTKLQKDQLARGEMSPADLPPKEKPATATQSSRLAPLKPYDRPAPPARQPQANAAPRGEVQPTTAELMAAIEGLRAQFVELKAALLAKEPRLDA